jgi:hypothetical protein
MFMPKFKFELYRRSITCETYWVEADTEEEAIEKAGNCEAEGPDLEFLDWYDDNYVVESKECIDPLYVMVKDYKSVDSLDV